MRDAYAYVPQVGLILRVAEGTGDNLLREDRELGYVDYIYYELYEVGYGFDEVDGGMITTREYVADHVPRTWRKRYRRCSSSHYGERLEYTVMRGRE